MDNVNARDIAREYTASYAKYVAVNRSIPSLVDGLKPVHRRCVNSADDLKIYHDKKFLKVAKLEGTVCGDYHPHGGANMTILAQPWAVRYPLFEGQGNFGSPDSPDSVAACFTGDTSISLLDGREVSIKEIFEEYHSGNKDLWVYSCQLDGRVVPRRIIGAFDNGKRAIIKVTLDTGDIIKCTPDHRFMLKSGEYIEASRLTTDMSLMPLYRSYDNKGYEYVKSNASNELIPTHRLDTTLISGYDKDIKHLVVHHVDFNKRNNNPTNLLGMEFKAHSRLHNIHWENTIGKPEVQQLAYERGIGRYQKEYPEIAREWQCKGLNTTLTNNPNHFKDMSVKAVSGRANSERFKKFTKTRLQEAREAKKVESQVEAQKGILKKYYQTILEYEGEVTEYTWRSHYEKCSSSEYPCCRKFETIFNYYNSLEELREDALYNHKIISIEYLDECEVVYDIEVEDLHNFALTAGIFVHNSRYIECRLTEFCEKFYLSSSDYADRDDNYDGRLKEVTRYYPPIPGSLLTGSSGIAVGLSTNIPTHTVSDVCKSLLSYIKNPKSDEYIKLISPETCEESIVLTPKIDIEKIYRTGEGSVQYKAKTHYESIDGKLALVVDAFPPDYRKKSLETSYIMEAVESGSLELRNESKEGIRYVFLSHDKEVLEKVEERLVSSTGYRMYIEHNSKIKCYKLSELYDDFIEARTNYIIRKYTDLVEKDENEVRFIDVLLEFKKDREYIKSMFDKSREEVIADIVIRYHATKDIAIRIVSSSLSSMMKDNADKLIQKRKDLTKQITEYQGYLENPINKIQLDIQTLYKEYRNEKRRAIHQDDVQEFIEIKYHNIVIKDHPSSVYYVATHDNKYTKVHAAELLEMDLSDKIVISSEFEYYVFYDAQGLIVVTKEVMDRLDNKFKSNSLTDIIGTNNLEDISIKRSNTKRSINLGDWAIRTRLSYIKQVDDGTIELVAQSLKNSRY